MTEEITKLFKKYEEKGHGLRIIRTEKLKNLHL